MAKLRKNFRLSTEALSNLERLSGLWGCDATAVVERALSEVAAVVHLNQNERAQVSLGGSSRPVSEVLACAPTRFRQEIKKPEWKK